MARTMPEQTEDVQKAINSLDGFIQQIYWGEDLSEEQAKKNIEEGLIQIIINMRTPIPSIGTQGISNGLLITKDGYFLTAKHCIDHDFYNGSIRDNKGRYYPLERVCARTPDKSKILNHRHDLALAKAKMDGPSEPMNYRIFNTDILKPKLPVALLYYNLYGHLEKKFGLVKKLYNNMVVDLEDGRFSSFPDQFVVKLDVKGERGNSGGVIVCPEGRIMGIASTADVEGFTHYLGAIKFNKALELVDFYKRYLIKKLE